MDFITGGQRKTPSLKPFRSTPKGRKFWQSIALTCLMCVLFGMASPAWAAGAIAPSTPDLTQGEQIFSLECAGCHLRGGNIIRRGKNLKQKTLKRNKLDSVAAIADLVRNGKNNMSAYGDRLSEAEILNVSAYVLDRAAANWRN